LTHGHSDHAGGVDTLKNTLGDSVTVYLGDQDVRVLAGEAIIAGKRRGSWPTLKTKPDVRLAGGERIGSLEVIPSPGHTPGHMAFLDTRDGLLFAGDTFTTFWGTAIPNFFLQAFPLAAMGTQDRDAILESARSLAQLNPDSLAVGHGPVVRKPEQAMRRAIRRSERKRAG